MEENTATVKEFYSLEQLSQEIGIAITGLRTAIKKGDLKAYKIGNRYLTTRSDIMAWLEQNKAD